MKHVKLQSKPRMAKARMEKDGGCTELMGKELKKCEKQNQA